MPLLESDYQLLLQKHKQHVRILGIVNGEDFRSYRIRQNQTAYEMQNR
jgi:hypothetical protein